METLVMLAICIVMIILLCRLETNIREDYEDKLYKKFVERLEEEGRI